MKTTSSDPLNFTAADFCTIYQGPMQLQCAPYLIQLKYLEGLFADILSDNSIEISQIVLQILKYESILHEALSLEECHMEDFLKEVGQFIQSLQTEGMLNRNIDFEHERQRYRVYGCHHMGQNKMSA